MSQCARARTQLSRTYNCHSTITTATTRMPSEILDVPYVHRHTHILLLLWEGFVHRQWPNYRPPLSANKALAKGLKATTAMTTTATIAMLVLTVRIPPFHLGATMVACGECTCRSTTPAATTPPPSTQARPDKGKGQFMSVADTDRSGLSLVHRCLRAARLH